MAVNRVAADFGIFAPITRENLEACKTDNAPHRICFTTTHKSSLRRSENGFVGRFTLPFFENIGPIFEEACGLELFRSRNSLKGHWRSIKSEEEYRKIELWIASQTNRVFIRDLLEHSIALDHNLRGVENGPEGYTLFGELESRAKEKHDEQAIEGLVSAFCKTIAELPFYRDAKLIAAVPPRPGKLYDLPSTLALRIANRMSLTNVTSDFVFGGSKGVVKKTHLGEKWAAWEHGALTFKSASTKRPSIILIDDKYQSGTSIHYVAARLRSSGAGPIYGLCAVKTWRDTDNT